MIRTAIVEDAAFDRQVLQDCLREYGQETGTELQITEFTGGAAFLERYPEDLDLTIPYVAPLCNGKYDSRLFDFICDTAGNEDDRYKDKAAELRKLFNDNSNLGEGTKSKSDWIKTTDEKIIMIYGNSDPWYAVRINDVARDNVHIFVHPSNNHMSAITLFPEAQRNQILNLLVEYLLK